MQKDFIFLCDRALDRVVGFCFFFSIGIIPGGAQELVPAQGTVVQFLTILGGQCQELIWLSCMQRMSSRALSGTRVFGFKIKYLQGRL